MAEPTIVESGADLASMAPPDLFSGADSDQASSGSADAETIETPDSIEDAAPGEEPQVEEGSGTESEPEEQEEPAAAASPQTEQQAEAEAKPEALPEGVVRGKDRNGKPGLFVEDSRWKNIYGNHQLVQQVSEMLGEPATMEALQLRNEAYLAQERLFNDLTSGDPQAQSKVVNYFLEEMQRAREQGEVPGDPAVPLAQTFYTTLRDRAPDAYATLRFQAARDLIGEMFDEAAARGDESLWLSAQHFARALANVGKDITDIAQVRSIAERMGIPFYAKAEMQGLARGGEDPVRQLQAENARLHALVNGKSTTDQAAQFDTWFSGVAQAVRTAVLEEAVKPALASIEKQWQNFPADYNDLVVDRLQRKVTETIRADAGFNERIRLLNDQARRAASAQRREELGQAIRQAYVNRARLAVEAVKRPILEFAASRLKERVDQNHARRQAAQNRTAPKGTTSTVPRSLTPSNLVQMPNGVFDPEIAVKQARQLLFGG
jgi:hypothetical protein